MKQWPHSPPHHLEEQGAYMVTCGTYQKAHYLRTVERLTLVESSLFELAAEYGWQLRAWAVLSNHYHFVASSPEDPNNLSTMLSKLHTTTAIKLNKWDISPGRRVWYQHFDSHITFQTSYLSRLKYVHQNPVHHSVIANAENYSWCSAAWFKKSARLGFYHTVDSFKIDKLQVHDEFEVVAVDETSQSGVEPPHSKRHSPTLDPGSH
jgi:putative transposase